LSSASMRKADLETTKTPSLSVPLLSPVQSATKPAVSPAAPFSVESTASSVSKPPLSFLPEPPSRFAYTPARTYTHAPTPARTQTACPLHAKRGQTYYHPAESCRLVQKKPMTQPPPLYSPQEVKALVSTIITELSARIAATPSSPQSLQPTPSSPPPIDTSPPPKSHDTAQSLEKLNSSRPPVSPPSPHGTTPTKPKQPPASPITHATTPPLAAITRPTSAIQPTSPAANQSKINAVLSCIRGARIDCILARIKSTLMQTRKVSINVRSPHPTPPPTPPPMCPRSSSINVRLPPPTPPHTPPASAPLAPPPPSPRSIHPATTHETATSSLASFLPYAFLCVMLCTLAASTTSPINTSTFPCTATPAIRSTGSTSFSF
jgi:hypothetical protein